MIEQIVSVLKWQDGSIKWQDDVLESWVRFLAARSKRWRHCSEWIDLTDPDVSRLLAFGNAPETPLRSSSVHGTEFQLDAFKVRFVDEWSSGERFMDRSHTLLPFSRCEVDRALEKLKATWAIIELAGEEVSWFVRLFTYRVELINAPSYGRGTTSTGDQILRTIVRNAHSPEMTPLELAEGLVHEAIHSYLNIIEMKYPIFLNSNQRTEIWSKWTGQQIDYYSLPHACFVWFGLFGFYRKLEPHWPSQKNVLRNAISLCSFGFRQGGGILDQLGLGLNDVAVPYRKLIEQIQSEVRTATHLSSLNCINASTAVPRTVLLDLIQAGDELRMQK